MEGEESVAVVALVEDVVSRLSADAICCRPLLRAWLEADVELAERRLASSAALAALCVGPVVTESFDWETVDAVSIE